MSTLKSEVLLQPQEIFSSSSTQGATLGQLATTGDGRYYRYVLAGGTTLVIGKLQQAPAETTAWEDLDIAAASSGATSITTTSTVTVTANQWANGYMTVTNGTGAGYLYQISGNPAATGAVVTFSLSDPLQTALANTVDIDVIINPFSGVIIYGATATGAVLGNCVYPITNAQYGWLQVRGVSSILCDAGNLTVGAEAYASDDTDGAVGPFESDTNTPYIGVATTGISSTEYGLVDLRIS